MKKDVMLVTGAGQIGMALARRVGFGKKIVLGDKSLKNAEAMAKIMNDAGYDVEPCEMDLSSREDIRVIIAKALEYGEIKYLINAAGVSPSQAPIEAILKVDLYGTAVLLEEVGRHTTMKKGKCLAAVLLAAVMSFALCGCSSSAQTVGNTATEQTKEQSQETTQPETTAVAEPVETTAESTASVADQTKASSETTVQGSGSNILVLYFSRTGEQYTVGVIDHGNTAIVAEMIADETGADMFEVLPVDDHYPMTYAELTDVAKQEQNEKARPAYAGELPDLSQYDTVFIGAPVWWGDWPMIMYTVFENNDSSGKKLIPFSTHEGSGLSGFDRKLQSVCPASEILEGLAIRGNDCQNNQDSVRSKVKDWLGQLGY